MDVSTKSLKYVTSYKWDVEDGAGVSHDRRHIAFLLNENGVSTLHVLDIGSGKELRMPTLPAGVISNLRWHENNRDLGFQLNTSQSPSDVYSVNIQSG